MDHAVCEKAGSRFFNWPKGIVILSLLAVPVSYALYARLSGQNHFGQGIEHSFYRPTFWLVQALAFFGLTLAPCLRLESERRQCLRIVVGILGFLFCEALSFVFIAFNGFPD